MEGSCSFNALVGGVCGFSVKDRKRQTKIIPLLSYRKKIANHKSIYKFTGPKDEVDHILCRAPKFTRNERVLAMMICPNHRTWFGLEQRIQHTMQGSRRNFQSWPEKVKELG